MSDTFEVVALTPEQLAARKKRNLWLALALVGFVVLVGATTAIRISENGAKDGMYFSGYMNEAAVEKEEREKRERADAREAERAAPKQEEAGDE